MLKTKADEDKYEEELIHPDPHISKAQIIEKDGEMTVQVTKVYFIDLFHIPLVCPK